jgi:hypothetical protein
MVIKSVLYYYISLLKVKRGSEFPTARRILLYIFFKRGCEFPTAARCRILLEQDALINFMSCGFHSSKRGGSDFDNLDMYV